jgi:hypothetical protein
MYGGVISNNIAFKGYKVGDEEMTSFLFFDGIVDNCVISNNSF